ncbi:MAG TPA: DNRLRE domain-containing protein [bacterium]|nr:DNRLRE domain-containing protein [bacterium]HQL60697.1 DNRLRE domain-containing protein [bacterium]
MYPNIDLTVRYVHDTLKVDTIVKAPLMKEIRAQIGDGRFDGNNYLTARFSVLQAAVIAEARQGGEMRDLYAEPFTINEPLLFVRDNQVIHEVRPVEAYLLDNEGQPVKGQRVTLRTAQRWQLERNAPGIAEMSVILADLANLPDGDLCIDPTSTFGGTSEDQDTLLYHNSSTIYGTSGLVYWEDEDHLVFGFHVDEVDEDDMKEANKGIISATLEVYAEYSTMEAGIEARARLVETNWSESTAHWTNPWTAAGGDYATPEFQSPLATLPTSDSRWFKINVTSIMKMHYVTGGVSDVENKGFLIKMEDPADGDLGICFSEHGTSAYRPKLVVTYSMPTFGADAGYAWDEAWDPVQQIYVPWPMTDRQKNMKADRLYCIRHFGGGAQSDDFVQHAYENGMKVIYLIAAGDKYSSGSQTTYPTAASYASHVYNCLNAVSDYIDGTISNTVIAVELGNEEDGEQKWAAEEGGGYDGGQDFAAYYVAARKEIKQYWPQLEIISGGSLSYHRNFNTFDDPEDEGGGARAFFCGFIDAVKDAAVTDEKGDYDYLPDTVSLHAYHGQYPSEGENFLLNVYSPWAYRLSSFADCCKARGYLPNFAVTEYAYSPTPAMGFAPATGASETSQAVYYMRSCLINATVCEPGINWKYSLYFHHCRDDGVNYDLGFHDTDNYPGTSRAARYVAREISCATGNSPGLCPESTIWTPFQSVYESGEAGKREEVRLAWCSWKKSSGDLWGAIWRHNYSNIYFDTAPDDGLFTVDGDFSSCDAHCFKFTISDGVATYQSIGGYIPDNGYSGGKTSWTIPCVDENPTFIWIYE